jgi:hypothetical protein
MQSAPSGIRTRVAGVRDRRPRSTRRSGPETYADVKPARRPRSGSASGIFARTESARADSVLALSGAKLRRLGSNQHPPGNNRSSFRLNDVASCTGRPGPSRTGARGVETHCSSPLSFGAKDGGSRTRTCERSSGRLRGSNPLPFQLGHASSTDKLRRKERESNPQRPMGPLPVFETGYRADGSPSRVAPAGLEPARPRVRTGSSAVLSYGAKRSTSSTAASAAAFRDLMARDRCQAIASLATRERGRQESNLRRPAFQAGALPSRASATRRWARLDSNQQPLVCETSAHPVELLARAGIDAKLRDKGSNLDLHVQSVASYRLDDPGACSSKPHALWCYAIAERGNGSSETRAPSVHLPQREIDATARVTAYVEAGVFTRPSYVQATRLPFDPGSPFAGCTFRANSCPTWRGFGAGASRAAREMPGESKR